MSAGLCFVLVEVEAVQMLKASCGVEVKVRNVGGGGKRFYFCNRNVTPR